MPNKPVGVFVQATFPRVVGVCEVEADTGLVFDMPIGVEFGAVVGGNCCEGALFATDKLNDF